jgi:alpha-ketoglutarate-dependent taurine dioxygenase
MFPQKFLKHYSSQILDEIAKYGALLLRGFNVESTSDFEQCIHSIQGMRGMHEVLLSEPGRSLADGCQFVFYTNKVMKSGGTLRFGFFHTENYNVPDVPRYVSFWCKTPSALGGETGLVNMVNVYADLPDALKQKLADRACLVSLYPIAEMVSRYGVCAARISEFCERMGLPVVSHHGDQYVAIYKPSVIQHPNTLERTLLINSFWFPSIERQLLKAFSADYAGRQWLLHRLYWRTAWLRRVVDRVTMRAHEKGTIYVTRAPSPLAGTQGLPDIISEEDLPILATSMRSRFSSFLWKRGDVLILDNLKMAHNGMAGRGNRELRVMLCNPVPLPLSGDSPGLHFVAPMSERRESLGDELTRVRAAGGGH